MARYIAGRIVGKVGDLVFSSKNGVNYVKSVPKVSGKTQSLKQMIQCEKFGMVMRFLSPIRNILNESYRMNPKTSGLTVASRQILAEAVTGEYPDLKIDFAKVYLTSGTINKPRLEMSYLNTVNDLQLCWTYVLACNTSPDDELFALLYCPSAPTAWHELRTGIVRSQQQALIKLPNELLGHQVHIWMAYRSAVKPSFSECQYLGPLFIQKPDSHESD